MTKYVRVPTSLIAYVPPHSFTRYVHDFPFEEGITSLEFLNKYTDYKRIEAKEAFYWLLEVGMIEVVE